MIWGSSPIKVWKIMDRVNAILNNKKKLVLIIAAVAVIGFILSPLPGIEAIKMTIVTFATSVAAGPDEHDLEITVLKDIDDTPWCQTVGAGECGPAFDGPETIGMDKIIHVVIDEDTATENACDFAPDGTFLSGVNCVGVAGLRLDQVEDLGDVPGNSQYFGFGYQYFYGRAYSNTLGYFGQLLGSGSLEYGLTAATKNDGVTPFLGDVKASYKVLISPAGLTTGTHTIITKIIDTDPVFGGVVLKDTGGPQSFANIGFTPGVPFPISGTNVGLNFAPGAFPASPFSGMSITFPGPVAPGTTMTVFSVGAAAQAAAVFGIGIAGTGSAISIDVSGANPCDSPPGAPIEGCIVTAIVVPGSIPAPGGAAGFATMRMTHVSDAGVASDITRADAPPLPFGHTIPAPGVFQLAGTAPSFSTVGAGTAGAGGGAGGAGGAGGGGGGGGGGGAGGGKLGTVKFYEVSWDVCDTTKSGTVSILGGTDGNTQSLGAKIRTSSAGVTKATLAADQPFEEENKTFKAKRLLFVAPISAKETFFTAYVENQKSSVSHTVQMSQCSGKMSFEEFQEAISTTAPLIPDGKTFTFTYDGHEFTISYKMDGTITGASVDEDNASVSFTLSGVKGGELLLALPRGLVDATNDEFVTLVTVTGQTEVANTVTDSTSSYAILQMTLPQDAKELTVLGTSVIPEFGVIAAMILAIAVISVVVLTRMGRLNLVRTK